MTSKEIKKEIREHRAEMKAAGMQIMSFMNGGQHIAQMRANERLFALNVQLADAIKAESLPRDISTISEYGLTQKLSNSIRCF